MHLQELSKILSEHLASDRKFLDALPIVQANTAGNVWLIGSAVYRTLAHKLYGGESHIKDYDFLAEQVRSPLSIFEGWEVLHNRYGNPKLKKGELIIDIVPIANLTSTTRRNLPHTIEHYLTGTPFTIQSIAYDIKNQVLLGEMGIKSILTKIVSVNCREEYEDCRLRYGESYAARKYIDGLGFEEI